jgi:hypothetical protein
MCCCYVGRLAVDVGSVCCCYVGRLAVDVTVCCSTVQRSVQQMIDFYFLTWRFTYREIFLFCNTKNEGTPPMLSNFIVKVWGVGVICFCHVNVPFRLRSAVFAGDVQR